MRFRRQYTLFKRKREIGKPIWYFRIYLPDGTRRAKSTGCTSKEKAMMFVENILDDDNLLHQMFQSDIPFISGYENRIGRKRNAMDKLRNMTFAEFAASWWRWDTCPYVLERREAGTEKHPLIKKRTVQSNYSWTQNYLIPYFGKTRIQSITPRMITKFLSSLKPGLSNKTINNIRETLNIMMEDAVKRELIHSNPVLATLPRAEDKKEHILLTDDECNTLFAEKNMKKLWNNDILSYTYSFVAGLTGLRAGELLAITFEDISKDAINVEKSYDSKNKEITTTKTSETRVIPITAEIYRLLYTCYHSHSHGRKHYIFSLDGDNPMSEAALRKAFYKALERIGIDEEERRGRGLTFHSWRHKFATECVKANMHPLKITAITGHKSIDMLYRYTDLDAVRDLATEVNAIQKYYVSGTHI